MRDIDDEKFEIYVVGCVLGRKMKPE